MQSSASLYKPSPYRANAFKVLPVSRFCFSISSSNGIGLGEPTPLDATAVRERSRLEQRQRELERKVRKWKRLEEGSQAPESIAKYKRRRLDAQKTLREFIREHDDVLRRDYRWEKTYGISKQEPDYIARSQNVLIRQPKTDLTMSLDDDTLTEDDVCFLDQYKKSNISFLLNYTLRSGGPISDADHKLIRGIDTALSKLRSDKKLRIGIFKYGGESTLTLDLSAYVDENPELREIYPLKDDRPTAVLNNGIFVFESNKNIVARVFEIDVIGDKI